MNVAQRRGLLHDSIGCNKTFARFENRPFGIKTAEFVAFLDFLPCLLEYRGHVMRCEHYRIMRQVIEETRCIFEKQRQIILDPAVRDAFRHLAVNSRARRPAFKPFAIPVPESRDVFRIQRYFPRRQYANCLYLIAR